MPTQIASKSTSEHVTKVSTSLPPAHGKWVRAVEAVRTGLTFAIQGSLTVSTLNDEKYVKADIGDLSKPWSTRFRVHGKNDCHIFLSTSTDSNSRGPAGYEIVIGGWANAKSVIGSGSDSPGESRIDSTFAQGEVFNNVGGRAAVDRAYSTEAFELWQTGDGLGIRQVTGGVNRQLNMACQSCTNTIHSMWLRSGWGSKGEWRVAKISSDVSDSSDSSDSSGSPAATPAPTPAPTPGCVETSHTHC